MFNFVPKPSQPIGDYPLADTLFSHITWKYKPSQPIRNNPLWPCPLRVANNFVHHSYIYIYNTYMNNDNYMYTSLHVYINMYLYSFGGEFMGSNTVKESLRAALLPYAHAPRLLLGWDVSRSCSSWCIHHVRGQKKNNYQTWCQWEFQDPKMEVLYHIRPYFAGISPYIGLI